MTTDAMIGLCFLVAGLLMMALLIGAALLKAAAKPAPAPSQPVTARPTTRTGRPMAYCEACGRVVAVRKGDGMPYAGRHACRKAPDTLTDAHAEGMRGQPTTGGNAA